MLRVLVARVCLSNVVSERRFQEFSRGIQDQGLWASSGQRAFIGGMSAVVTATHMAVMLQLSAAFMLRSPSPNR